MPSGEPLAIPVLEEVPPSACPEKSPPRSAASRCRRGSAATDPALRQTTAGECRTPAKPQSNVLFMPASYRRSYIPIKPWGSLCGYENEGVRFSRSDPRGALDETRPLRLFPGALRAQYVRSQTAPWTQKDICANKLHSEESIRLPLATEESLTRDRGGGRSIRQRPSGGRKKQPI